MLEHSRAASATAKGLATGRQRLFLLTLTFDLLARHPVFHDLCSVDTGDRQRAGNIDCPRAIDICRIPFGFCRQHAGARAIVRPLRAKADDDLRYCARGLGQRP